jgi:hypothetical protein
MHWVRCSDLPMLRMAQAVPAGEPQAFICSLHDSLNLLDPTADALSAERLAHSQSPVFKNFPGDIGTNSTIPCPGSSSSLFPRRRYFPQSLCGGYFVDDDVQSTTKECCGAELYDVLQCHLGTSVERARDIPRRCMVPLS